MTEKRKKVVLIVVIILLCVAWIAMEIIKEFDISFGAYESGIIEITEDVDSVEITIQGSRHNLYEAEAIEFVEYLEQLEVRKEAPKTPEMLAGSGGIIIRFYENEQEILKYYIVNENELYSYEECEETGNLIAYKVKENIADTIVKYTEK